MLLKTLFVVSVIKLISAESGECIPGDCTSVQHKHYEDLGCLPVKEAGACCPSRYDCSNVKNVSDETCYFNGKTYNRGESLDQATGSLCAAACTCSKIETPATFNCANIECPDLFNPQHHCVKQYTSNGCCADKTICEKADIEKLGTCSFEGKTYRIGENMYPNEHSCYKCTCAADFDSAVDVRSNKACHKINCGTQLRYFDRFKDSCIPIYHSEKACCPFEWRCPTDTDSLVETGRIQPVSEDENMKCSFGNLKLNIGDSLNEASKCETCKCLVPPMISCVKDTNC